MFCMKEAIHNTFRNNISYDDLGGILSLASNPDAYIANNHFYIREGVPFKRKRMRGKYTLKDNKITTIKSE